jgi:hypothetical protein
MSGAIRSSGRPLADGETIEKVDGVEVIRVTPAFEPARYVPAEVDDCDDFLQAYTAEYSDRMEADGRMPQMMRFEGDDLDAEAVLAQFARSFVVRSWSDRQRRIIWGLCRDREFQLGMPAVLASVDSESLFDPRAAHVYFFEVPERLQGQFAGVGALRGVETVRACCTVYVPHTDPWRGKDGRERVSQLDSDARYVLPMLVPFASVEHARAWYEVVKACVRHLWMAENRPPREIDDGVEVDSMDPAELAALLAGEPF